MHFIEKIRTFRAPCTLQIEYSTHITSIYWSSATRLPIQRQHTHKHTKRSFLSFFNWQRERERTIAGRAKFTPMWLPDRMERDHIRKFAYNEHIITSKWKQFGEWCTFAHARTHGRNVCEYTVAGCTTMHIMCVRENISKIRLLATVFTILLPL